MRYVDGMYAASDKSTPLSEANKIRADILKRVGGGGANFAKHAASIWKDSDGSEPAPDKIMAEVRAMNTFLEDARPLRPGDLANALTITILYCWKAKYEWNQGRPMDAWSYALFAARWHGVVCTLYSVVPHTKAEIIAALSSRGKKGAEKKLARDVKQPEIKNAKRLWQEWKDGKANYRSTAAWANYVVSVSTHITDTKNLAELARAWAKEAKSGKNRR